MSCVLEENGNVDWDNYPLPYCTTVLDPSDIADFDFEDILNQIDPVEPPNTGDDNDQPLVEFETCENGRKSVCLCDSSPLPCNKARILSYYN